MKTIQKFLQVFFLIAGLTILSERGTAQNLNQFSVEVQHTTSNKANGKIYISLSEGAGSYTFKLYDIYDNEKNFKKVIESYPMQTGKKELIFNGLPASGYVIQVIKDGKKLMLGGMNGFIIQ